MFEIHVDTDSELFMARAKQGGLIRCPFYASLDGNAFPGHQHMDFAVVVLGWWLDAYVSGIRHGTPAVNSFMDGPFELRCVPQGDGALLITPYERTLKGMIAKGNPSQVKVQSYEQRLRQAAEALVSKLDTLGYSHTDLETLRQLVSGMRTDP